MLRAARIGVSAPWLARTGLILAVIATLACNVGYGVAHAWPGALLSGWPAVAFVVAAETTITMTRQRPSAPAPVPASGPSVPEVPAGLNGHADRAAEIFAEDLAPWRHARSTAHPARDASRTAALSRSGST
jgi:hypothetical protein